MAWISAGFDSPWVHHKNMSESEPKNRGDKTKPMDVSQVFLHRTLVEFRDFLDDYWRHNNDARVFIEVNEAQLNEPQKLFLGNLKRDHRAVVLINT